MQINLHRVPYRYKQNTHWLRVATMLANARWSSGNQAEASFVLENKENGCESAMIVWPTSTDANRCCDSHPHTSASTDDEPPLVDSG